MSDIGEGIKWIPVKTVARCLKVSRQMVYKLIKQSKLKSRELDGNILVSLQSLNELIVLRAAKKGKKNADR